MQALLEAQGFLGTGATLRADLALVLVVISAGLLTLGWWLARRKHFTAHGWVQTGAVTLNTAVVLLTMLSSYWIHILPGIPSKLGHGDYAFTTLHALVGLAAMTLGVFVVLRANNLVPQALRFRNYRLFMRTAYALYMLATLLGVIVYVTVYVLGI